MPDNIVPRQHLVRITATSLEEPILSWLPENITFNLTSHWDYPLQSNLSGSLGLIAQQFGATTQAQEMTLAVWSGSTPIEMTIQLEFIAEEPGESIGKVINPIRSLCKLALPRFVGGGSFTIPFTNKTIPVTLFQAPGPKPLENGGDLITVEIGTFLRFRHVVITQVTPQFHPVLDRSGLPLRAGVTIGFKTHKTPVKSDLETIIGLKSGRSREAKNQIGDRIEAKKKIGR